MAIAPSLACARQLYLAEDMETLLEHGLNLIHYDVMDGHCVKNLCLSLDTARELRQAYPAARLDVHLMVQNPDDYLEPFAQMGAERVGVHLGTTPDAAATLREIRRLGMRAGIVLNPDEPILSVESLLADVDYVLLMAFPPGFAGKPFDPATYGRLEELTAIRRTRGLSFEISVDGGITPEIGLRLTQLGVDILVAGYLFLFRQPDGIAGALARWSAMTSPGETI